MAEAWGSTGESGCAVLAELLPGFLHSSVWAGALRAADRFCGECVCRGGGGCGCCRGCFVNVAFLQSSSPSSQAGRVRCCRCPRPSRSSSVSYIAVGKPAD